MRMDTRARTFRWPWLLAGSLLWIFASYPICLWAFGRNLQGSGDIFGSQCGPLQSYNGYAYAQCMHDAADAAAAQSGNISTIAALISIGPVLLLLLAVSLSLFVRSCRTADETHATPISCYRNAQRRRWKAP